MKKIPNIRKIIKTVIAFNIVQAVILLIFLILSFIDKSNNTGLISGIGLNLLFYCIILLTMVNSFITIKSMYSMGFINNEQGIMKNTLDQLEDLNRTLRAQRHDFINHLQVVYSLMEMTEYNEARDYIEKVYNDIQKVNRVLKTTNPAVNALLQAKLIYAEKKEIEVFFNITSQLSSLTIPSWEFCRVLGNIIDNAIYALESVNVKRRLEIKIFEDIKNYGFRVINNGPQIPAAIIDKIFEAGYTTKGTAGDGMGLAITREILKNYSGEISVKSNEAETVFEGLVPKQ